MDNIPCDPSVERSKQYSYDELVKEITRVSMRRRLRYAPNLPHDVTVVVQLYGVDTSSPS